MQNLILLVLLLSSWTKLSEYTLQPVALGLYH